VLLVSTQTKPVHGVRPYECPAMTAGQENHEHRRTTKFNMKYNVDHYENKLVEQKIYVIRM